jgi:fibronectin type 3 domain-containing protein
MNPARRATAATVVLATAGGLLSAVTPSASAATVCAAPVYTRTFYANTTFSGTPKKTDCDSAVDQNWSGAPATGLPKDNFGVRWTVTRDFGSGGPFSFTVSGTDGIRVHLDGVRKVDLWSNTSGTRAKTVNVTVPQGKHTLRLDYVNWTGAAQVKFAYTPRTSATVDTVKPLAPTGTSAAYDASTGRARLTWARNKEMDLAGYRVYRRAKGSGDWRLISGDILTAPSFTDTPSPTGAAYYYEVRAVDKAGNESAGSTDQLVTTVDRTPPKAPVLTAANDDLRGVTISWDGDSEGGLRYELLRASSPAGDFVSLGSGIGGSGTVDETAPFGVTSYYRVTVTDPAGNSARSDVLPFTRPPAKPHMWSAETNADETGVTLRWAMAKHAPTQFRVYRTDRSDDNPVAVRVDCAPTRFGPADDPYAEYTCTDYSAVSGTEYWYQVASVDTDGRESEPSAPIPGSRTDHTPPPAVTGLTYTNTEYGTVLQWDESTAPDLASYTVFRGTSVNDTSTHEFVAELKPGTTRFVDLNVPDNENLVYFVDAVDQFHNSLYTLTVPANVAHVSVNEFDLTPGYQHPATAGWALSAQADETGHAALSWTCGSGCAAGGFHVYRWDRAADTYVRLTDVPLAADARGYTDPATPAGTTSYYVVSVVAADGTEAFSRLAPVAVPPSGA